MAATESRVLANAARCHASCIPDGMQNAVIIYLLAELTKKLDPTAIVTPATLIQGAKCYNSCIPPGLEQAAIIYLLAQIQTGIGNSQVIYGTSSPSEPGGDFTIIYVQWKIDCNALWIWQPPTTSPPAGQWVQFDFEKGLGQYTVPTTNELRAIATQGDCPPVSAITFGNLVVGDAQPAHYRWDSDDVQADDGMAVIVPDDVTRPDPGSWLQFTPA